MGGLSNSFQYYKGKNLLQFFYDGYGAYMQGGMMAR